MRFRVVDMITSISPSITVLSACLFVALSVSAASQSTKQPQNSNPTATTPVPVTLPRDYVIGVEDILTVVFWRDKELSAEVVVRPDGKISLPMLSDIPAAGMTPEQLAEAIEKVAANFVRDPGTTVMVKAIHSRKVYVIGEVARSGTFPLASDMNVLQVIAQAGGLLEHANKLDITIVRNENGKERRYKFNYNDVVRGKNVAQNIRLLPGDTILVR